MNHKEWIDNVMKDEMSFTVHFLLHLHEIGDRSPHRRQPYASLHDVFGNSVSSEGGVTSSLQ